ncbi:hypothetical protein ACLJYM_06250 [Rhizobium giardinii]|uniref:hypothetical protein n=1 Tax=Rhizobium giardinii TaxID=56731 RepID=UPI0039DF72DB
MTEKLDLWNRFADIDPKFTKPISGRDYGGTSPNPQYVIRCLTEMFGPVGKGFGWSVLAEDFKELGGTYLHWCRIKFWWKDEDGTHGVEEYGQTKAAYVTSKGTMRVDEDAPKKSLTDAIVKGASHVGIAANIFLGRWDDQKYVAEVNEEYRREERGEVKPPKQISAAEQKRQLAAIDQDLLDCESIFAVNTCAKTWASIMERDGWSRDYREAARPKFQARRDQLQASDETTASIQEQFPGSTVVSDAEAIRHPLNA